MNARHLFNRRAAIAGSLGAALGTATLATLGPRLLAQDAGTPDANQDDANGDDRIARLDEAVANAIATVRADRDAVATQIDPIEIDDLIGRAGDLADKATTGDDTSAGRRLRAVFPILGAAEFLIGAQLVVASPPSREGPASRGLDRAYAVITAASDDLASSEDEDVTALLATARDLYASAYDQFGGESYTPAARTGQAAALLARAARILDGDEAGPDLWLPRGRGRDGDRRDDWRLDLPTVRDPFTDDGPPLEPVDVPEPDF